MLRPRNLRRGRSAASCDVCGWHCELRLLQFCCHVLSFFVQRSSLPFFFLQISAEMSTVIAQLDNTYKNQKIRLHVQLFFRARIGISYMIRANVSWSGHRCAHPGVALNCAERTFNGQLYLSRKSRMFFRLVLFQRTTRSFTADSCCKMSFFSFLLSFPLFFLRAFFFCQQ